MNVRRPAAVFWDFDGTLVDSEGMWVDVERGLARELGRDLPAGYHEHTVGGTVAATAAYIAEVTGTLTPPSEIEQQLWSRAKAELATGPIRWRPGAEALLASVGEAGVLQALVSSGHRAYLRVTLDRLVPSPFAVVVAGDEVAQNKPHPQPYLDAANALGVDPASCVVIEDSQTGAASGLAAGCVVLGVPSDAPLRPAARQVIASSLIGWDADRLFEAVSQAW